MSSSIRYKTYSNIETPIILYVILHGDHVRSEVLHRIKKERNI